MNPNDVSLLQLINAAVTPVVMISACSTIILGINTKNSGAADRVRELARTYRDEINASEDRKANLREQVQIFYRRFLISRAALWLLYIAIAIFIACVVIIVFVQKHLLHSERGALYLFVCGILLMFISVCLEFLEIHLSKRSLFLEVRDLISPHEMRPTLAANLARFVLGEKTPKD